MLIVQKLLLYYLRNFPNDFGKSQLVKYVKLPSFRGDVVYKSKNGIYWILDLNEYQMKQIFVYDIYERNSIRHLLKIIRNKIGNRFVFIDVGANIGFYSLTIARACKDFEYQIHCFEPNPFTHSLLNENIKKNRVNNIILNRMGLSDREATATLTYNQQNLGTANTFTTNATGIQDQIQLQTLDKYCNEKGIKKVDIIKVDIEGGEFDFLKGAKDILYKSRTVLMIMEIVEANCNRAGYTSKQLFDYCIQLGFKAYLPKAWPFKLKRITKIPLNYHDNIFFLKGFE